MSGTQASEVVMAVYQAFGRGDLPAILGMLSDSIDWRFIGPQGLPFTGHSRGKAQVTQWFAAIAEHEDIQAFEPREFISDGRHVTVLGWERTGAKPGGKVFESEWAHVWTVDGGKVTRFWGIYDSEASAKARS